MKKKIKIILLILLFFTAVLTIKNNNIKAATYGHYTYEENGDGTITITKYDGTAAKNLVIPSTINGKSVTSIGHCAFEDCKSLTGNLTIPDSVTSIGAYAFSGCSAFTGSLTIPDGVTSIRECAFDGCSGLTGNLIIPDSVTYIENDVFKGCKGFTNLTLKDGVKNIGEYAFSGCSGFTGNLVIPSSVTSIGSEAFARCSGFTGDLIIPDSVESIGSSAFSDCSGFTGNLTIGNSVTRIEESAFDWCSGFTGNLTIGNSVTSIGYEAFRNCSGFTGNLVIPDSVISIGRSAFYGCDGFNGSLTIGNSVTSIGNEAFIGCDGLKEIRVNINNPSYISDNGILYNKEYTELLFCIRNKTGNITITNSVTKIGDYALAYCTGLTGTLVIPDSVTNIGSGAFFNCSGLTGSLIIPDSVTSIGDRAFFNCSGLTGSLIIPDSVTSIGDRAFSRCRGFTGNLTIGNSVTSIDEFTFSQCSGFTGNLTIGNSVTYIGQFAFKGCSGFTGNLTIGNSVEGIDYSAFSGCSGFTGDLVIPNSVTGIGSDAFEGCSGFTGNLTIGNSVTYIGGDSFSGCSGLTGNLTIPNSVTSIGSGAFEFCKSLTGNLTISNSVTNIANSAFANCRGLTGNLTIPNSVTSIGDRAFDDCKSLTGNLTIPDSVTSIGNDAFSNCSNIDKIIFVGNAPNISSSTFSDYSNKIYYRKGTTGYTAANNWPTDKLVQYTEALKKTNYTINELLSGASRPKIELDSTLSPLVTATFDVANTNIISISKSGNVGYITPLNNGTTQVTVNLKYSDSVVRTLKANVTVDIKVTNVNLDKTSYNFSSDKSGQTLQLNATVLPEKAKNKTLNWTSSNTNIATVDSTGKVTTVGNEGECVITATTTDGSNISATCNIKVPKMVKQITFDKSKYTITNDTPIDIKATVSPSDADNSKLDWTSSNTTKIKINSVSSDTKQIAVSRVGNSGKYTITAIAKDGSGVKASCEVEVNIPPTKVSIDKTEYTLSNLGDNVTLKATITPNEAYQTVNWTSSNTDVATVDSKGKVTAKSPGECDIIATSTQNSSIKASCKITVEEVKVTSISLNKTSYTFTNNTPLQLKATVLPENATNKEVTWESTNPSNVVVDQSGKVTVTSNSGSGMIIARAKDGSGKQAICSITINLPTKYISLNNSEYTLSGIGESVNLKATIRPSSMSQEVNWISSNTSVATVDNSGKVTSVGVGTSIITATSTQDSSLKASCEITVEDVKVTSITLNKTSYTFTNFSPLQLIATVLPENATNKEIEWTSTNPSNIVVDQTGKVTVKRNSSGGMIIASAKDGSGKTAICNIKVNIPIPVTSVNLNKTSYTFTNSTPLQLNATVSPEDATNKEIEWTSSNTSVATVDSSGKVTPKANGTGTIIAKAKDGSGKQAICNITVNIVIQVTSITLDKSSYTFTNSTPLKLNATVSPENATNKEIEWTSTSTSVATVDSTGKVTPKSNGICTITAMSKDGSGKRATCDITVNMPILVTSITLNKTSYTFTNSTPLQLKATVLPANAENKEITWESTNPSILAVDQTGKVTVTSNSGNGMIIARAKDGSGKTAICNITIDIPTKYISLNKSEYTLNGIGESTTLNATVSPSSMSQEVNWTSSNTSVATVDNVGKVTSVGVGTCEITATSNEDNSLKASCNITVQEVRVTSITLNKTSYTFTNITPLQLTATILPENAVNKEVEWTSNNTSVATVDNNGKVTPKNNGTCKITVKSKDGSEKTATCDITVNISILVTSITLTKTSYTFTNTTPLQLNATVKPDNATNKEITWESTNPSILVVDQTGKVMVTSNKGSGMIIARAKDGSGKSAVCNITVNIGGSTYKKGDINKDGKVTVMDVRYGLKALTKGTITAEEIKIGDVNGDGKFSVMDARKILRFIVGKISSLD